MRRLLTAMAIGLIAALTISANATAAPPARLSPAAQSLSRCVQTNGRVSVLMLIDESGSLATTDPYNQRVDGIRAALTGLADLSETPVDGSQPQVSVLMAGFFGLVRPNPEEGVPDSAWKPVTRDDIDELLEDAGQYESLNQGRSTDYATALIAARKLLADRAAEQTQEGGAPCQALIWFTDGRYSLPRRVGKAGVGLPLTVPYAPGVKLDEPGAGEQAVNAGKQFMCKPNGLMDRLQSDGVIRFTVALSTELSRRDAAFLDAATTGRGGAQRCGAHLSPLSGEYLSAKDGDRLFFAFASLGGASPPVRVNPICPKLACVRGATTFVTVPGLNRFLIKASGGAPRSLAQAQQTLFLQLDGPGGQSVTLKPDGPTQVSLAGTTITQRWVSSRAVEVQGDFSPGSRDWLGRWSYSFVNPAASAGAPAGRSYSAVQLFADLAPSVKGSPVLIRGSPTTLEFELDQGSSPDRPVTTGPLVRSSHLVASIDDPIAGTSTRIQVVGPKPDGSYSAKVTVPATSTAGFVYLGLTASFSTPGGTPIAPQYRSFDIPVRFPPGQGFPTISPSTLDLPSLQGLGETGGTLTVKASSVSSGCVWLGAPKIDAPSAAGQIKVKVSPETGSASRCIRLAKGEAQRFNVRLLPSSEARGTVSASFPVHLRSDLVDTEHVVSVPAGFAMAPAPDVVTRAVLLVVLVLLGTLLPLLLLHALNVLGARFAAPNRLRVIRVPVEMAHGGRLRQRGEGPSAGLGRGETLASHGSRQVRELEIGGLKLETVASGSLRDRTFELFRGPYGVVRANGKKLVAGARQPLRSWRDSTAHEVPLGLAGTWIFRFDSLRPAEAGGTEEATDSYAGAAAATQRQEGDVFFGSPGSHGESHPEPPPRKPREAMIEGELILLISDGPPLDQGEVLYQHAEEGLKGTDSLWEERRPEPKSPPTAEEDTERPEEPAESPESPAAPASEGPKDWKPTPEPSERPAKRPAKGTNEDFF